MSESLAEQIGIPVGVLRRIRESDAEALASAVRASLRHLEPWMPWANQGAGEVNAQLAWCREAENLWGSGSEYIWLLRPYDSDVVAGSFGLHRRVGPGAIEVGYWVHVGYLHRGYATAGARALTVAAFELADVERVLIRTDEQNKVSAAVPRRLGYRLDRVEVRQPEAPAESGRLQIWARSREESELTLREAVGPALPGAAKRSTALADEQDGAFQGAARAWRLGGDLHRAELLGGQLQSSS